MDVVTTSSLDALLERASGNMCSNPDMAAIEAFWEVIKKEREGPSIGVRLLAQRILSPIEMESLQALNVLDICMKHCGPLFQAEVGKFRFLNELIKIVSPKYLGTRSSPLVRNKILHLMHNWIKEYPRETKIKEAFEMLKKQGVVREDPYGNITPILTGFVSQPVKSAPAQLAETQQAAACAATIANATTVPSTVIDNKTRNTIFEDEEKSKLLQKLLRSKNPDDLQAANRLIKTMVREDEKRVELISRRSTELQTVHNNARLLSEMLDSYRPDQVSSGELELIKELYQSCERLRPAVFRLASETQQNEELLNEVLEASVALGEVFEKYKSVIIHGNIINNTQSNNSNAESNNSSANTSGSSNVDSLLSLLDLTTPAENPTPTIISSMDTPPSDNVPAQSNIDALSDIFNNIEVGSSQNFPNANLIPNSILQPVCINQSKSNNSGKFTALSEEERNSNKSKAFKELDALGETLLKENLSAGSARLGNSFKKSLDHTPLNMIKTPPTSPTNHPNDRGDIDPNLDLDYLIKEVIPQSTSTTNVPNGDDAIISGDLITPLTTCNQESSTPKTENNNNNNDNSTKDSPPMNIGAPIKETTVKEVKPLTDLFVTLDNIKPGKVPPLTVLEKNEITVILHFAQDSPRDDVSVLVVSTISKSNSPLTDYLFQAVVPKTCKLKLQPPSGSSLPAHNPFLPPAAITQVLLIANPSRYPVSLKFMISYTMDEETVTEMGEVEELPLHNSK